MRCKAGDLCVVVNDQEEPRNNGALVKVLRPARRIEYALPVDWECEAVSLIRFKSVIVEPGERDFAYRDMELRPIRDPGPDAVDETLDWLNVPTQEGQPA